MLPFVFNAEDGGKRGRGEEVVYDPQGQQQQMQDYYKQYEEQMASRGNAGNSQLAAIQAELARTQHAIQMLNEEKEQFNNPPPMHQPVLPDFHQPPPGFPIMSPMTTETPSRERKRSRSPSWARRSPRRSRSRSRDRRRNSSRDRKDDKDRDRDRRRRRDHSRSRSPSYSGSSKSARHSRRRHSRSRSRDRDRNSSYRNDRRNDRYNSEWNPGIPSNKLAILNMPNDVDNAKITFALGKYGYLPQDVRTMTKFDKNTKNIRTFAFVEFSDLSTAEQWMNDFQGYLTLDDGRRLVVEYAKGDPSVGQGNRGDDWICAHCSMNNFVKRQTCFKCEISKDQSMELEKLGAHMVGMVPCDTLLIRGLPDGVNNTQIFDSLSSLVCLNSISMIKLSDSKRFAYLQMKSSDEAKMLLNLTYKSPINIKNKDVQVSWCKDSMSRLIQQQMTMLTAGPMRDNQQQGGIKTGAEIAAAAISKAHAVRQASHQVGQLMTTGPVGPSIPPNFSIPPPNLSAPPPVVLQPAQPEHQNGIVGVTQTPKGIMPKYLPPNPLTFVHDPNVGYYVDPITKFCYDQTTGYYFNNETAKWCTWDHSYQTYFPVETPPPSEDVQHKKSEEEGPKTAADLVKDMKKWEKKQEKDKKKVQISLKGNKEEKKEIVKNVFSQEKHKKLVPSAFALDDDDEDDVTPPEEVKRHEPSTSFNGEPKKPTLQEIREAMERALYDEAKKTCMLCKRAFSDVDVLRKHVEKSDLHRKNLEAKRAEWGRETAARIEEEEERTIDLPKIVYRDRAKERRRQFGIDSTGYAFDVMGGAPTGGPSRNEDSIRRESEEASKRPLDDTNIGNRLLKSMGWKEGQGVGKHAQGIVNPIQAERFVQGAGLGAAGSKMRHGVEATHKEKTRQALYSRYHDPSQ